MQKYSKRVLESMPLRELDELLDWLKVSKADSSYILDVEVIINDKMDEF